MTFYYKRVFPIVMLGFMLIFIAVPVSAGNFPPLPFFLMPIAIVVFGYFVMKHFIFDMVDEAWDAGDALVIRNKSQEDRIPLSSIINVNYSPLISPPRVTLLLRNPGIFGDTVTFCAPIRFVPFARSPVVDDLIRRIDVARGRNAAS